MIQVILGDNVYRQTFLVDPNTTLRALLEEHDIDYSIRTLQLNGRVVAGDDLDQTFADFGITEKCSLLQVAKADPA
jgi:hypothetical protein